MQPLVLPGLALGDRVQHELRVIERSEREKRDGERFVILTLGNASGEIATKPIWANQIADGWVDGAERGAIVQVIGHIASYEANGTSKRQLALTAPVRLVSPESARIEEFLPAIEGDITKLWDALDRYRGEIGSVTLQRVLALFFGDDDFRLRFERVPASIKGHHAKLGGLLLHVWEVTRIARGIAQTMRANVDLVTAGALLHDVGKVEAYDVSLGGFARTAPGYLIEHVVLGCLMLEHRLAALDHPLCTEEQRLELEHIILSHHGTLEFGSPVRALTLEAEIVHWADESSAKSNDMLESLGDTGAFGKGEPFAENKRLWRVDNRRLWKRSHSWE
ncbi:MAG TPA: HD domain-containing protein [Gemmatimonadaceae bacterium]|nr:HD domain-containing protein [Gemmatimonadaceae bacterium]